jgi:hypothetical protein
VRIAAISIPIVFAIAVIFTAAEIPAIAIVVTSVIAVVSAALIIMAEMICAAVIGAIIVRAAIICAAIWAAVIRADIKRTGIVWTAVIGITRGAAQKAKYAANKLAGYLEEAEGAISAISVIGALAIPIIAGIIVTHAGNRSIIELQSTAKGGRLCIGSGQGG